jgi:hypothetical protein
MIPYGQTRTERCRKCILLTNHKNALEKVEKVASCMSNRGCLKKPIKSQWMHIFLLHSSHEEHISSPYCCDLWRMVCKRLAYCTIHTQMHILKINYAVLCARHHHLFNKIYDKIVVIIIIIIMLWHRADMKSSFHSIFLFLTSLSALELPYYMRFFMLHSSSLYEIHKNAPYS